MSRDVLAWNKNLQSCFRQGLHKEVVNQYQLLRLGGFRPNASTFPSIIVSCTCLSLLQLGEQIHGSILRFGCQSDPYVVSALVDMYAKCHRMEKAWELFEKSSTRNVASWTALIQGYSQIGRSDQAFLLFDGMQRKDSIRPNAVTVMSMIPACLHVEAGDCIHGFAMKTGLDTNSLLGTSLADMYLKFGEARKGAQVFHSLEEKNEVSWLVMVTGFCQNGLIDHAVSFIRAMLLKLNLILDSSSLTNLLSACADRVDLEHGKWAHVYILKTGIRLDPFVGTALLDMYAKCGLLASSCQIFGELSERNLVSWNAIINSHARVGSFRDVVTMFRQLNTEGLCPDSITLRSCFLALSSSSCYQQESLLGECFHSLSIKTGFFSAEVETANSILDFYVKTGNVKSAYRIFSEIENRADPVSWNCLMNGYAQNGYAKNALYLFSKLQWQHVSPDAFTLSIVLGACSCIGDQFFGKYIHGCLIKQRYGCVKDDSFVATALVDMYAKCGDVQSAYRVFEEIHVRDTATWNAMVAGFSQNGCFEEALGLFYYFLRVTDRVFVSDSAVGTAISACGSLGFLEGGKCLHGFILKNGLERHLKVGNALLSMYPKCGAVTDAELCFNKMDVKDTISWTAMIAGYGTNGRVKDVLNLFEKMMQRNLKPNRVTFLEVLWACSHGGLVKVGWNYFEKMRSVYGIERELGHFCCIVDLLGRAGHLYEAYLLIRSMKMACDEAIWGALLAACKEHRELELGMIAAFELSRLDGRENGSYFVLASNAFAASALWEEAEMFRNEVMAGGSGTKKPQGWSQVGVRG